eukprot:XP_008765052.2 PREDICTED: SH2 domain-containing protein 3A isoform X1 [Rattus norvegicus]
MEAGPEREGLDGAELIPGFLLVRVESSAPRENLRIHPRQSAGAGISLQTCSEPTLLKPRRKRKERDRCFIRPQAGVSFCSSGHPSCLLGLKNQPLDPAVLRTLRSLSVAHHLGSTALHLLLVDCQVKVLSKYGRGLSHTPNAPDSAYRIQAQPRTMGDADHHLPVPPTVRGTGEPRLPELTAYRSPITS